MNGAAFWSGKTILITGGTGTFGRAAVPALLDRDVRRVIILSRDELKQAEVLAAHRGDPVDGFLGDVRDAHRLQFAFRARPDVVIHAAALKRVESCEANWAEAIETNVLGTRHVVDAALLQDVPYVLALSTDKACQPINNYGRTKAMLEGIVTWANAWRGLGRTRLSCVRYGNVLGSRGSVVPLFQAQRASGRVTVTDPSMTRFWMTLDHAVAFVLSSVEQMQGGEVFVPKLPASSLAALVAAVAPGCEVEVTGRRPGEKQHEVMLSGDEAWSARDLGDRFAIYPAGATWPIEPRGRVLPDGFRYTSDQAPAADLSGAAA